MSTRTKLQARLAKKETSLAIAEDTYDKLLAKTSESYRFDSGDGSQSTKNVDIGKIRDQIDTLESDIAAIQRRLSGLGLTKITLNRKSHCRRH